MIIKALHQLIFSAVDAMLVGARAFVEPGTTSLRFGAGAQSGHRKAVTSLVAVDTLRS